MIRIAITDRQNVLKLDERALRKIARDVLNHEGFAAAEIGLVFVGDEEMQVLNLRHLSHDYPTDVLSFVLDEADAADGQQLEAEIVVSTETAAREAPRFGWPLDAEVTLYLVHGLLHACGYDDLTPPKKARMRRAERLALQRHGLEPRYRGRG